MYTNSMKKITTFFSIFILIGCSSMQSNIEVDSIETFNLGNYSDFSIKINDSNVSTEINPIELERFRDNLKSAIEERGLSYSADSDLAFNINLMSKDKVMSNRSNYHYLSLIHI